MIRDINFTVPNGEKADQLATLCELEGWTVSREHIHHYEKGVPVEMPEGFPSWIPDETYTSVTAQMPNFDYDRIEQVHAKADELAAKVGGECVGGGCSFEAGDHQDPEPVKDEIPWDESAQPILDHIVSEVGQQLPGLADQAMMIHERLIEAGWTPPPRVFLKDDDIPSHIPVIDNHGEVRDDYQDWDAADEETYTANYDVVEMNIDYDAAVEREKARRAASSPRAEAS